MKFSKKSEYGLRALIELTAQYGKALLQRNEIAHRQKKRKSYRTTTV